MKISNFDLMAMATIESINDCTPDNIYASLYTDEEGILMIDVTDFNNEENGFKCPFNVFTQIIGISHLF